MRKKNNQSALPAAPYVVWSSLFIVIPLLIVVFFGFTIKSGDSYHFGRSILLAVEATLGCLILGYPVAYLISKMREGKRNILIMLFIIPMWMNFLLRTYAWLPILGKNGLINSLLVTLGFARANLLYNDFAVLLGMIYNFLPFMILPIYTVLIKMDTDLINAASDLGASRKEIFTKIIFPLSMPGIISGITMVFMPAVSTFVISRILGGGQYMLLGNLIETQYTSMDDWNFGSAIAIFMMIIILISMAFMNKFEGTDDK